MQTISLTNQYEAPTIQANRYETGRFVQFRVEESLTNVGLAIYIIERKNGIQIKGEAEIDYENNAVSFNIPCNALLEAGKVPCVLSLYYGNRENQRNLLSSFVFYINVQNGLLSPEGTYQLGYDQAMSDLQNVADRCEDAYENLNAILEVLSGMDIGDLAVRIIGLENSLNLTNQALEQTQQQVGANTTRCGTLEGYIGQNTQRITNLSADIDDMKQGKTDVLAINSGIDPEPDEDLESEE